MWKGHKLTLPTKRGIETPDHVPLLASASGCGVNNTTNAPKGPLPQHLHHCRRSFVRLVANPLFITAIMPAATQAQLRSPSPAPPPPIADAPGPRAQGLINIYNQAVDATLKKCSTGNFASCFPTAAEQAPEVLESLRSQVLNQLQRTWKLNFDDIMAKRNVVQLLNSLDQCIEDARLRKKRAEANGGPVETPVA